MVLGGTSSFTQESFCLEYFNWLKRALTPLPQPQDQIFRVTGGMGEAGRSNFTIILCQAILHKDTL